MLALASMVSLGLLVGCAGTGSPAPSPSAAAQNLDNWPENMQGCLREKGWDVEVKPDGGVNMTVPAGQAEPYNADFKACEASFGYDAAPVYSEDQIREIYTKVVATAECLTTQGHDPGSPPSEQTFMEQVQSGAGGWDPYSDLFPLAMSEDKYYEALGKCPRTWH